MNNAIRDPNELFAPYNRSFFNDKTDAEAKQIFTNAGFTNVQTAEINNSDLIYTDKNIVDKIDFGGSYSFSTDSHINKDKPIVIYYYPITIYSPINYQDAQNKTGDEAYNIFTNAGFKNVKKQEIDGSAGFLKKKNLIDHISLNGETKFSTTTLIRQNDPIVIYYFSK